jgi:hypothetical protein
MNTEIKNDPQLIAYCGLYCGSCRKYLSGKCPGCRQIQGKHWCNIRTCNIGQKFSSCADCSLETPNACKKFNNPISKVFALVFGSNREKCILTIRQNGAEWYAAHMAETRQQSLKSKS